MNKTNAWLLIVVFLVSLGTKTETAYAQDAPAGNYLQAFLSLKTAVRAHYLDSASGLYHPDQEEKDKQYSYLWPLCALFQAANEEEKIRPGQSDFQPVWKAILHYYDSTGPAPAYASYPPANGGGSRFYDDNQWIGITLLNAYPHGHEPAQLTAAEGVYRFMMTGYDTTLGGGLYWEEDKKHSKNTCSNGPGILVALQLYQVTRHQPYLDTALLLYNWVNERLRSPQGLYFDNIHLSGRVGGPQFSYNSGTMMEAAVYLYEITRDQHYLDQARGIADAALERFYAGGHFQDALWFNAVQLRAFQHFLRYDRNIKYVKAFENCTLQALKSMTMPNGLMGTGNKPVSLVDQAGMMEILARLAWMQTRKLI